MGGGATSSRPTKRPAPHRAAALVGIVAGTLLVIMGGGYVVFQTCGQEEPQRGPGIRAFASKSRAARQGFPQPTAELAAQPQSSLAALASLEVESVPPGQVRVNGKVLGSSPLKIHDQRPGEVRVEVFNPTLGFSKEQVFRVAAGDNGTRRIEVSQAELEIRVLPYATVLLDGKMLGRTPLPPMQVYEGKHRVLLVNRELGKEISVDCTVKPGQLNLFQYNLAQ
jgi:serine/threonine-protein kinase